MTEDQAKRLFDAIRIVKGSPLTTVDVARINAVLNAGNGPKVPQAALDLMHDFESFRPDAYRDPGSSNGLPITIGWGSTSDLNGNPIKLGDVWSRATADAKFAQDVDAFSRGVLDALKGAPTSDNQFGALVSLAYNIGLKAFSVSTLLTKHKAGDYAGAKAEFPKWKYNDGKVMAGLVRRRKAEAELYAR